MSVSTYKTFSEFRFLGCLYTGLSLLVRALNDLFPALVLALHIISELDVSRASPGACYIIISLVQWRDIPEMVSES